MTKKPNNVEWIGFTAEQSELLDSVDFIGNNAWARNSQTDAIMTRVLDDCAAAGLTISQVKVAMRSIGYGDHALRMLDRWERKRTTGRFDPPRHRARPGAARRVGPPRTSGAETNLEW